MSAKPIKPEVREGCTVEIGNGMKIRFDSVEAMMKFLKLSKESNMTLH